MPGRHDGEKNGDTAQSESNSNGNAYHTGIKVNIISELFKKGLSQVAEVIIGHLDFQSILKMHKVCTDWSQFLKSEVNPYQVILKRRIETRSIFKQACHLNNWTKYIMSSDPSHYQRIKHMAYIGTYISEKQRLSRSMAGRNKREPDFVLNQSDDERKIVKEMRGKLFVAASAKIAVWNLSQPTAKQPEKVLEIDLSGTGSPKTDQDKTEVEIEQLTTNSEYQPWEEIKMVAAGVKFSNHEDDDEFENFEDDGYFGESMWYVWNYETSQVIRTGYTWNIDIEDLRLDSKHLIVCTGEEVELEQGPGRGWGFIVFDIAKNFKCVQQVRPTDGQCMVDEDKIVWITQKDRNSNDSCRATYRHDGKKYVGKAHLPSAMDTEGWAPTLRNQVMGNLGMVSNDWKRKLWTGVSRFIKKETLFDVSDISAKPKPVMEILFKVSNGDHLYCKLKLTYGGFQMFTDKVVHYSTEDVLADRKNFLAECASVCDTKHDRRVDHSIVTSTGAFIVSMPNGPKSDILVTDLRNVK